MHNEDATFRGVEKGNEESGDMCASPPALGTRDTVPLDRSYDALLVWHPARGREAAPAGPARCVHL